MKSTQWRVGGLEGFDCLRPRLAFLRIIGPIIELLEDEFACPDPFSKAFPLFRRASGCVYVFDNLGGQLNDGDDARGCAEWIYLGNSMLISDDRRA